MLVYTSEVLTEVLIGCDKNVAKSFIYLKGMSLILVGKIRNKCCSNGRELSTNSSYEGKTEDTIVTSTYVHKYVL